MGSWGIWNQCKIDCWPGNDFEKWLAWCDDSIMMMIMKMRWCQTTSRKLGGECISWKTIYGKKHISYWSFKNKPSQPHGISPLGGPLCPHKKKTKTKTNHLNPTAFSPLGGGGGKMPIQEKKNKPSHLNAGKSYLNQSVLEKLF